MTTKNSTQNKFIDRIGALYLKLLDEKQDEQEAAKSINAFVSKALKKFGFNLAADKMEERTKKIAQVAIARAKKSQREMERHIWLMDVKVGAAGSGYTISFLPDIRIRNTPEARDMWEGFLDTLAPKTRIGPDPKTGTIAILYRDGEWLGNLMLADDVRSLYIIPEIHTVLGDFIARGARVVNSQFSHTLTIQGALCINYELLRQTPPALELENGISLYGVKSPLGSPFTPDQLRAWGLKKGHRVKIRSDVFIFNEHQGATLSWELTGENVLTSYVWKTGKWQLVRRERIDPAVFEQVAGRLSRICLMLGLGADFIAKSVSRTQENIDKICLYLDLARLNQSKPPAKDDPELAALERLILAFGALRAPFSAAQVNSDAVLAALGGISDDDVTLAGQFAKRPRYKVSEKLIRHDLDDITRFIDEDTDSDELLADGLTTARFLHVTFKSDDARGNLASAAGDVPGHFRDLVGQLPEEARLSFGRFLEDPEHTLKVLRKRLSDEDHLKQLAAIEGEIRVLQQMRPKELIRKIVSVPFNSEDADFQQDKALLNQLFAMQKAELKDLPFDAERLVDLLIPRLKSFVRYRLDLIRSVWKNGPEERRPITAAIAEQLRPLSAEELIKALRRIIIMVLDVVRAYNALSTTPAGEGQDAKREVRAALPADAVMTIRSRLSRACLSIGVGRAFIDDYADALVGNLHKMEYYLELALGEAGVGNHSLLEGDDRELIESILASFRDIRDAAERGQVTEECAAALKYLKDDRLDTVGSVLSKPRPLIDVASIKNDVAALKTLQGSALDVDTVFGSPGRFLLFLNSSLESKQMKRTVSTFLKPVYFAITKLGKSDDSLAGLSLNDVLKAHCTPDSVKTAFDGKGDPKALAELAAGMKQICDKGAADIITHMRKTREENPPPELERDQEFVARLLAFERKPLGALELQPRQTSLLLLLRLESFITESVKALFEDGAMEDQDAKTIIKRLLTDLKWRYEIIRTYNKLTTPAKPKATG
ncbi:hypothetical protein [Desulfobaculum sp.]